MTRRFTMPVAAAFAVAAALTVLMGPAQAAPEDCETGYFTIDTISGPVTAGDEFTVTVNALDCSDEPLTGYAGPATLDGAEDAEPGNSPNGDAPDYGTIAWTNGVGTADVTLYAAETARQLTVSDGDLLDGVSNAFNVAPGALASLAVDDPGGQTAGTPFTFTAHAFDAYGNVKTDYAGGGLSGTAGESPDGFDATYGTLFWDEGQGTAQVTLYNHEPGVTITITDGVPEDLTPDVSATSDPFDVAPGALASFTVASVANQTAGTQFAVQATAYDAFGNVKTDYAGGATVGGATGFAPGNSPNGTPLPAGAPAYGTFSWTDGVGNANVTLYKAESGRKLEVDDAAADVSATSDAFGVGPGALASFTVDTLANQTAGTAFAVGVTAFDAYGNVKTDYAGGATVGGATGFAPGNSPNGTPAPAGAPAYGTFSWTDGVGSANVTLYRAQSGRKLEVADSSVTATSNAFDVAPGPLASFTVAQVGAEVGPPTHYVVEVDSPFNVSATAFDPYGNLKTNYGGGATLGGTLEPTPTYGALTFVSGVGTGSVTADVMSIDRKVTVTDGTVTADSNLFDVVADVCTNQASCTGTDGSTTVELFTPDGVGTGTASVGFFTPAGGTIQCQLKAGGTTTINVAGAISLIDPPPGYTQNNPLTLKMTLAKGVTTTGPGNLIICLSKNRGATFEQVVDCGKKFRKSDIPCITSRIRTGAGVTIITALITSTDPWGGIG